MLRVALTGGIGSGKSLVGEYLEQLGAIVFDSDQLARDVVERGTPGFDAIVKRFGDGVLTDGQINRAKLAELIFNDKSARADLEGIIHPRVKELSDRIIANAPEGSVVVNQIPILFETNGASRFDLVITVESENALRFQRLRERGMKDYEIEKRMAAQASTEQRRGIAHFCLENNGTREDLLSAVERLWENELAPRAGE
ncbi:MAG: dephospho-CoA kinase [Actinobacteria bacterium]|jgi:dephospho-CoA kinase|nr:dephospho-CoA kinase [Actinomycetota bacterium]